MLRLLMDEFEEAVSELSAEDTRRGKNLTRELSLVTGQLAYPYVKRMADVLMERFPGLLLHVYAITNHFSGNALRYRVF